MIDNLLIEISNNKLFGGAIMLLTNIGGKYLALELPTNIEKLFSTYSILRYLVLFSIFFMATRDIKTSVLLALLFFIFVKFFINENSTFCLLSKDSENNIITKNEYENAKNIVEKYNNEHKTGK
jgi:hypothetical protein